MRRNISARIFAAVLATTAVILGHAPESRARTKADYFPDVPLQTQDGKTVRFYDDLLKGKIVVINFMYAGCGDICPAMMMNLLDVQKILGDRIGRDIFMYSITLQPEFETPAILKAYSEGLGVQPGWTFLTGDPRDIDLIRRRLGFVDPDPAVDADLTQHIGVVRFGNEALDRWAGCPALTKPEAIAREILWMVPPEPKAPEPDTPKR